MPLDIMPSWKMCSFSQKHLGEQQPYMGSDMRAMDIYGARTAIAFHQNIRPETVIGM